MKIAAIILVAGKSTRFDSSTPKQMYLFNKKPVFSYSLNAFYNNELISQIIVVSSLEIIDTIKKFVDKNHMKNVLVVEGGRTRKQSVENGLAALNLDEEDYVLIHDGARPLIDKEIIDKTISAVKQYDAVTTYIPMEDTIAIPNNDKTLNAFANRNELVRIQTPQAFKFSLIKKAHENTENIDATDDCSLVMKLNKNIKLIEGSKKLIKITTIEDLRYLETLAK